VASRPIAAKAALRIFQNRARSAASAATRTSVAPASAQKRSMSANCASTSWAEPSSSTSSAAPASVGQPAWAAISAASMESVSIISIAAGTTPRPTIAETASPAASGDGKKAARVRIVSGTGITRSQIFVTTASVPSEPTSAASRS